LLRQNLGTDGQVKLTMSSDALVFLKRWKDSRQFEGGFETLSGECAEVLGIEQDLAKRDFRELIELDYFRLIDQKIISDLVRAVASRTVSSGDVSLWVRQRRQGHWYREYRHLYEAVDYAAQFKDPCPGRGQARHGQPGRLGCSATAASGISSISSTASSPTMCACRDRRR
jgi:hypothetical protein